MHRPETLEAVAEFTRSYFEAPDLVLAADTCLVARLNGDDPEEFVYFLEAFSRRFDVKLPRVSNRSGYLRKLWEARGFRIGDLAKYVGRWPELHVSRLPVERLCEIAESGAWPAEYVFPQSSLEHIKEGRHG